jgi:hypothetical protein
VTRDLPIEEWQSQVDGKLRHCPFVRDFDHKLVTCKRRDCPRCGAAWARDWQRNMETNLRAYGGPVVLLTITAPGEERLPWDEDHCRTEHGRGPRHKRHRGPDGCRVQQRAAREWSDTLTWRWAKLRGAAQQATRRALDDMGHDGAGATILERAYEPQKRGVPHLHVVLGYRTLAEQRAAHLFVGHIKRLVADYDFGFADGRGTDVKRRGIRTRPTTEMFGVELRAMAGESAARYLTTYLTGRAAGAKGKAKPTIRKNISHPNMPRSLLWLTPRLTTKEKAITSDGNPTGVTMRMLRRARQLYAAAKGFCPAPLWNSVGDAVETALVYRRAFTRKASGSDPPPELVREIARSMDREFRRARRFVTGSQHDEVTAFAFGIAGLERPLRQAVAA